MDKIILLVQWGVALFFIIFGLTKLFGWQVEVELFDKIGFGHWFRYLAGVLEIVAGILLLIPGMQLIGAVLLTGILGGALLTQVVVLGNHFPIREVVLLVIMAWFLKTYYPQLKSFLP